MKAVQLLVNSFLPEDARDYSQTFDAKSLNTTLYNIATNHPDKFAEALKSISDIGRKASYYQGETINLKDLESPIDKQTIFAHMDAEIAQLPPEERNGEKKLAIFQKYNELIQKMTQDTALANRNNIAMTILSGARGKNPQLKAMITTPGTFSDYKGRVIPVFSKESFAEGIRPAVFLASTYGARSSVISTKCLGKDTLVRMGDLSVKNIQDIKVGDFVLGSDKRGKVFPVRVLNTFDQGMKECFKYDFELGSVICTKDHKFLSNGEVIRVGELDLNKEPLGEVHCYDIEVDHPDHLFVLANGLITSNSATAKGGDFSKQLASTAADMVIRKNDCGTSNGIELEIDDKSLKGRALAKDTKGIPAGTFITRDIIDRLRKSGVEHVVARSPLTCAVENGLCAHCVGKFYKGGKLPRIGDSIGLTASSVVGEPIAQGALCLEENTLVRMADGSEKKIKDITPGEYVVGSDKLANTSPVRVLNVFDQGDKECFRYEIESKYVVCTPNHKFLIDGEVTRIGEFAGPKDSLGELHCYDIEVDHPDHLFVLANGLIVSNSAKHTAGMSTGKKSYSGLEYIAQFTQSPEEFRDRAPVTDEDGIVESIEEAPQGGTYITVNGKKYYAGLGHEVLVSQGQQLEAGDQLAEGLVDPEDIVRTKGLGAGMLYYAKRLNKMLEDSSAGTDKRNTEVLARAAMRHVKVDSNDGIGSYLPDDVVDYRALMKTYTPPETSRILKPSDAVGKYLQKPVLHYTVGTRITPSVAKDIERNEYNEVLVDDEQPQFSPVMVRLRAASHTNPDWLASLSTSYLAKQLNESSTRGDDTNILHNTDFRPRLAVGAKFGENVRETGEF